MLACATALLLCGAAAARPAPPRARGAVTAASAAPRPATAPPTSALLARARRYWYRGLAWGLVAELWFFAVLAWLASGGRAPSLRAWAERHRGGRPAAVALFTAIVVAVVLVAELPFAVYIGYFRERAFGFATGTLPGWFADWGKSFGIEIVAVVIAAEILYAILRHAAPPTSPSSWGPAFKVWIPCLILMIVVVAIQPVFIAPLFDKFTPLPPGRLHERLAAMARQAGIPPDAIYVADTSRRSLHTNAYVVGLLGTQRIVIYDTLLRAETPAEVEFVVGHELGHYVLHHLWKGIAFGAALLLLFLWIAFRLFRRIAPRLGYRSLGDVAGLPLLALLLSVLFFLASPAVNGFSRRLERQADRYGLRVAPDPCAAVASFQGDLSSDLIPPDPPHWIEWWFFTHPSGAERIAMAQAACAAHRPARASPTAGGDAYRPTPRLAATTLRPTSAGP